MAELTNAQINAALERGKVARAMEPRAAKARYDRKRGLVVVELTNGCSFTFPPRLAQGLETATDDQLAAVEILGHGYGLHWQALDADIFDSGAARRHLRNQGLYGAACGPDEIAREGGGLARQRRKRRPSPQGRTCLRAAINTVTGATFTGLINRLLSPLYFFRMRDRNSCARNPPCIWSLW